MTLVKQETAGRTKRHWRRRALVTCAFVIIALGVIVWFCRAPTISQLGVQVSVSRGALIKYDDGTGRIGLSVPCEIRNSSPESKWLVGESHLPAHVLEVFFDGLWQRSSSSIVAVGSVPKPYSELRSGESLTFQLGPVHEKATKLRVGFLTASNRVFSIPQTGLRLQAPGSPSRMLPVDKVWVYSSEARLVRKGDDIVLETTDDPNGNAKSDSAAP